MDTRQRRRRDIGMVLAILVVALMFVYHYAQGIRGLELSPQVVQLERAAHAGDTNAKQILDIMRSYREQARDNFCHDKASPAPMPRPTWLECAIRNTPAFACFANNAVSCSSR
jgi:hypothetical protein